MSATEILRKRWLRRSCVARASYGWGLAGLAQLKGDKVFRAWRPMPDVETEVHGVIFWEEK